MHSLYDFVVMTDDRTVLADWTLTSGGETWALTEVFTELPWRPGLRLLVSDWNRREYVLAPTAAGASGGSIRFGWRDPPTDRVPAAPFALVRREDDLGLRYQLSFSSLLRALGVDELGRRIRAVLGAQPVEATDLCTPERALCLRLSPDTLYFHDAFTACILFLDALFRGRWEFLRARNLVVHPAMTAPETQALGLLATLEWICRARGLRLFVATLDPEAFKYLRATTFLPLSENDMHRRRTGDHPPRVRRPRYPTFMAWDAGWSPADKGLPQVLEAFSTHRVQRPLYIKVPDGYPDDTEASRDFYACIERYRATVDVRLVDLPAGRAAFLETLWADVEVLIYACHSDVGPRTVLEAAGMNLKILFHRETDCPLLRYRMFDSLPGFRRFDAADLPRALAELDAETSATASFFDRRNWLAVRDHLRQATGDPQIRGFWLECFLELAPEDGV